MDENNFNHGNIKTTNISSEMRTSFLDYSMSVIVARALPDVRDGMKPGSPPHFVRDERLRHRRG